MDTLSLLYKILAAASVLTAILTFVVDARGATVSNIPPAYLKPAGICLVLLAILFGIVDYLTASSKPPGNGTVNINSGIGGIQINPHRGTVSIGDINQTIIQPGDSAEVKQQKITEARRLIAEEILSDIVAIDSRLSYVSQAVIPDEFEKKLQEARESVAPSAAHVAAGGYQRLMAEANVASLRQAMNSSPLRSDLSGPLVQVLIDAELEVKPIRYFYDQLAEVQWATESLFDTLTKATKAQEGAGSAWHNYYSKLVALAVRTLQQRSELAYLRGLQSLQALGVSPSEIEGELAALKHLKPHTLPDPTAFRHLLELIRIEVNSLMSQRKALHEEGRQLLKEDLEEYKNVNELLEIKATDTWNEVVGKAVSLRQFGRVTEALAAFQKYGQMFAGADPTADRYARTAMAFTQQMKSLGLEGGVYVFQILEEGAARNAGMEVGDIVIEYRGKTITGMNDMAPALSESRVGDVQRITYLRLDPKNGRFMRHSGTIEGGPLGAGIMPI